MDPIAKQHTAVGALEFAVYYIKALDWSQATTDPYLLQQVSAATCRSCKTTITNLRNLEAAGGYLKSGRTKIDSAQLVDGNSKVRADQVVRFTLTQQPVVVVRPTATQTITTRSDSITSYVYVSWVRGHWSVMERLGP